MVSSDSPDTVNSGSVVVRIGVCTGRVVSTVVATDSPDIVNSGSVVVRIGVCTGRVVLNVVESNSRQRSSTREFSGLLVLEVELDE